MIIDILTFDMYPIYMMLSMLSKGSISISHLSGLACLPSLSKSPTHILTLFTYGLKNHCPRLGIRSLKVLTLNLKLSFLLSLYWTVGSDMQLSL